MKRLILILIFITTSNTTFSQEIDVKNIENETINLIINKNLRKKIQINSQKYIKHNLKTNSEVIDLMRNSLFPFKNEDKSLDPLVFHTPYPTMVKSVPIKINQSRLLMRKLKSVYTAKQL